MLVSALILFQESTGGGMDTTNVIRIVAGVLALVCVVAIVLRRKKKASKEEW